MNNENLFSLNKEAERIRTAIRTGYSICRSISGDHNKYGFFAIHEALGIAVSESEIRFNDYLKARSSLLKASMRLSDVSDEFDKATQKLDYLINVVNE